VIILPPVPPDKPTTDTTTTLTVFRIITTDATGKRKWWKPADLKATHPELF
jgi:hypothetical protein